MLFCNSPTHNWFRSLLGCKIVLNYIGYAYGNDYMIDFLKIK